MTSGLETIYMAIKPKLLRFVQLRGAGCDGEDILQDVWLKASQSGGPISNPEAYLYRCAHNVMIDRYRANTQRSLREKAWVEAHSEADHSTDPNPGPERGAEASSTLKLVMQAIENLGEPTTTIFRQFRIEGVPQRVIAAQLGLALPTIEKHLQRAYKAMATISRSLEMD